MKAFRRTIIGSILCVLLTACGGTYVDDSVSQPVPQGDSSGSSSSGSSDTSPSRSTFGPGINMSNGKVGPSIRLGDGPMGIDPMTGQVTIMP